MRLFEQMAELTTKPRILISTGIYPPSIGGPAQYAKNLAEEYKRRGFDLNVCFFDKVEKRLLTGFRHLYYFFKVLPLVRNADYVIAFDTFSVGLPTLLACRIFKKKMVVRTGGDFLWEGYVERTSDPVLLREFYDTRMNKFNLKEKIIFKLTKFVLNYSAAVIFSTKWQAEIFRKAYDITNETFLIENYYGQKVQKIKPRDKRYLASARPLKWKNFGKLERAFKEAKESNSEIILDTEVSHHNDFIDRIKKAYAVILVSLGDISPNTILDAISTNTPFILTKENGLYDRIGDIGVYVDPLDTHDIAEKILWLLTEDNWMTVKNRIERFDFTHSWQEIADEFLDVFRNSKLI